MKKPNISGAFRLILTIVVTSQIWTAPTLATELLMLEQQGCAWCARWHQEIGEAYPNTDQGKQAPLRRVDINEWPEDLEHIARERVTPTFVLISDNQEIARLRGYPGDHFFWPMLDEMLAQLPND